MRDTVLQALSEVLQVSLSEIDPDASFTQLGGHSMSAIALKSKCKENGILLSVETILTSPDVSRMVERAIPEPLPQQPVQVEQHLDSRKDIFPAKVNATHPFPVIEKTNIISRNDRSTSPRVLAPDASIIASTTVPMTEMQLSLVHGSQKQPGTNIIYHCETFRPEDIPTMRKAWQTVIEMEPIFRATFELSNGLLVDHPLASFSWTEVSVHDQQLYDTEVEKELQRSTAATRFKVVNLTGRSPQMNLSTIIWGVSHALIDGYSASLVLNKVRQAAAGLPIKPGASFFQVARELGLLRNKLRSDGQEFWRNRLEKFDGAVGELLLPAPLTHASSNAHHTETVAFQLPLEKILEYAQSSQVTMASFYHAAWALTLSMYTDSDTVVFGGVLSGRNLPLPGVESSIGPLVNTLPLHVSLDRAMTCVDYLRKTFVDLVELMSFQWTTPQDGYTRKFSSAMAMQFNVMPDEYDSVVPIAKSYSTTTSDIPLSLLLEADGVVQLRYHSNTYKRSDISMLAENFQNALQALCMPHQTLGVCLQSMLSCGAQEKLYRMGNCLSGFTTVRSVQEDLVSLFELVATQYPEGIAVEKGNSRMTYSELNSAANQVAAAISPLIKEGEAVCTHADQSINWIIAIYGILKAKGVYCPLAVTLPAELRNSMYISAGSTLFLTPYSEQRSYQPSSCISCMAVEDILWSDVSDMDEQLNSLKQPSPRPWATAYLCFTSGSTGKPKGVLCSHEGLVAFQRDLKVRLFSQPGWKIAQIMSPAFDGSIHEIFSALSYGATLVLQSSDDPFEHVQLVDSAILTPSIARVLKPEDFPKLSTVYFVGEPVPQAVNDIWASKKQLYNMYGPTEGTCGATIKRLVPGEPVTIGAPNHSTRIYILDSQRSLVPPGTIGEIYLAGVQIARGYIGRPEETANKFLPDSIRSGLGEQMYKTGDRGYWNMNGEIVCLGRNDRQIKLRGFRLDLDDLEIRMVRAAPSVHAVALAAKDDYLIAMIQPASVDVAEFRSNISNNLPPHALPRHIISVDKFPMTRAGKLDYNAIRNVRSTVSNSRRGRPSKPTERLIAAAWRDILQLDPKVTIHSDSSFFDLGGHSIMQLRLASRLNTIFQQTIPFRLILESKTLRDLAEAVSRLDPQGLSKNLICGEHLGDHQLSPIERDWWHKYELDEGSSAFNVSFACSFDPLQLDPSTLSSAWNTVLARHRILRCRYVKTRREGVRRAYSDFSPRVQRVSSLDVWKEINRPFVLQQNDPIRVTISADHMVVTISHIVCDLTTLEILLRDVASICNGIPLPPTKKTYMETDVWNEAAFECYLAFWTSYLEGVPEYQSRFGNHQDRTGYHGSSHLGIIDTETYHCILNFSQMQKITLHQLSLAAVALALQFDSPDVDMVLGGPHFNRKSDDELEVVGLFLEPLPIRVKYTSTQSTETSDSFIRSVRTASQEALAHAVPWNQLLHHLEIPPDHSSPPLIEAMVTFHDNRNEEKFPIAGATPLFTWTEGSKFKLMVEFCALSDDKLIMRLEYDNDIYSPGDIMRIETLITAAFRCLAADMPFGDIKAELRRTDDASEKRSSQELFGLKVTALMK